MLTKPAKLDCHAARWARALVEALASGALSPGKQRWVRRALAYYVAPLELIPDVIPGIGLADDYVVLRLAAFIADAPPAPIATTTPEMIALHEQIRAALEETRGQA